MAAKVSVNIFYVCDNSPNSVFKGIYAIKTINDKIEEINVKLESRIENRGDIDMIVKDFDAITVCILEKEIILRLTNDSIKVIGMRRSRGITFETVRRVMARLTLFEGVDETLYSASKHIGPAHDSIESGAELQSFAVALTREEIDQRFDDRRRRREERESGKFSTPIKGRTSTLLSPSKNLKSSVEKKVESGESSTRQLNDRSDVLLQKITQMDINEDDDGQGDSESDEVEVDNVDDVVDEINGNNEPKYVFSRSRIAQIEVIDFPKPIGLERRYELKENAKSKSVTFTRMKGSGSAISYYKIVFTDGTALVLGKMK
ncbi:unnamed protein product [Macrosiphum euphorbiae]|uniref:Uncharacterized protein n=1 Tax=Macrosiphum euphorbiae TaxID=13131 RepID=A0AAV0XLC4_9HEMI|nr:unnamed protein product [Macrosiphum euphorbiae]